MTRDVFLCSMRRMTCDIDPRDIFDVLIIGISNPDDSVAVVDGQCVSLCCRSSCASDDGQPRTTTAHLPLRTACTGRLHEQLPPSHLRTAQWLAQGQAI